MKNLKKILLFSFILFVIGLKATAIKIETIYFDIADTKIKSSEIKKLENLKKANQIFLIGHTDTDGNNDYNKQLSRNRVESVFNYFIQNGLSKEKIDFEYHGEEKPLNKNSSDAEKAQNRRVEIKYIIDPLMDFEVEKQIFDVNNNSETIIKGKDGTEIIIPANTFDVKNVKLELKEFYNTLDILSSNLSTKANGEMLETSGMVYLEAKADGKKVEPKNDITIKFKKMSESQNFQLFEGNREKTNLDMNWNTFIKEKKQDTESAEIIYGLSSWRFDYRINGKINYSYDWFDFFKGTAAMDFNNNACYKSEMKIKYGKHGKVDFNKSVFDVEGECLDLIKENLVSNLSFKEKYIDLKFNVYLPEQQAVLDKIDKLEELNTEESIAEASKIRTVYESERIVTKSSKLGWINCDRFLRSIQKTDFVVNISDEMNVRMVVKSFNSFYNGHNDYRKENQKVFTKIPLGEKVTLICTSYKDGKILLAIEETTIRKAAFSDFNFEVVSKEELKQKIQNI